MCPATVHTEGETDATATINPDVLVGLTSNEPTEYGWSVGAANVIVCDAFPTVTDAEVPLAVNVAVPK